MKLLPQNGTLHQILASIAAALAGFNSGMWRVWPSLAIPHLKSASSPFQASDTELSLIASLSYFSYFLSPFLCRYLIRFGRKFCVVVSLLLFGATWSAALVASNPYVLYGASIAAGFGNGLSSIIVPIYISEIASPSIRGALVTGYSLTFTTGQIFTAAAGIELRYHSLNLAGLAFSVFSFVLATVFVRETPQHHLIVGDDAAAKETHRYFHSNASSSLESKDSADQDLEEMKKKILAEMSSQSSFSELFQTRGSRRAVLIICLVSCFQMLAGISSIVSFSSITLPPTHSYLTVDLTVLLCLVLGVTSNSIGSYLIDLVGRRILLAVSSFLGSIITLALAVFYFLYDKDTFHGDVVYLPYALTMAYFFVFYLGMGIVRPVFIGELFPTNVKVHASMISILCISAASFLVNFIYLQVSNFVGVYAMFLIFTLSNICNFVSALYIVVETKGKTLFEIQEYFKGF